MGKLVNRAFMGVSGMPGTGTITLGSAQAGYQTFAAAGVNDQDTVSYVVTDGNAWEAGQGLYTASGTTLARTLIQSSTGSLLSLSSGATVYVTPLASDLLGLAPAALSANTTLTALNTGQDIFATASPTLTMPNGGTGWRTGTIRNANTVTGLITLAVPSGATLDGTTNGTTTLYPYQRARVIQTGATAYVTDWIDRSPIVAKVPSGAAVASWSLNLPAGYQQFLVTIKGALPGTGGAALYARLSDDGFATIKSGSSDYGSNNTYSDGSSVGTTTYGLSYWYVTTGIATGYSKAMAEIRLDPGGGGDKPVYDARSAAVSSGSVSYTRNFFSGACTAIATNRANGLQLLWSSGTGVADITVQGIA